MFGLIINEVSDGAHSGQTPHEVFIVIHRRDAKFADLLSFILLFAETPKSKMTRAFG
jgi:hypothetical protein